MPWGVGDAPNGLGSELTERAWARLTVGGVGAFRAEVVDFDTRRIVVAPEHPVAGAVGREALVTLGVGAQHASGIVAVVRSTATAHDGRACLVLELVADSGTDGRPQQDLPFAAKVDILVVSGRLHSDQPLRGVAVELSTREIVVRTERDLPMRTAALLRFAVPPNRGTTVQVRGKVAWCRPDPEAGFVQRFVFERVSGSASQQLVAAMRALAEGA